MPHTIFKLVGNNLGYRHSPNCLLQLRISMKVNFIELKNIPQKCGAFCLLEGGQLGPLL